MDHIPPLWIQVKFYLYEPCADFGEGGGGG